MSEMAREEVTQPDQEVAQQVDGDLIEGEDRSDQGEVAGQPAEPEPEPPLGGWLKQLPREQQDDPQMQELAREFPKLGDAARALQAVRAKIDPQQPPEDGYGIGLPDDMPPGLMDEEMVDQVQEMLADAGVNREQGQAIWSAYVESQRQQWNAHVQRLDGKKREAQEQLRREWGERADEMTQYVQRALQGLAKQFPATRNLAQYLDGVTIRDKDGGMRRLGDHPDVIQTLAEMGQMMAEAPFVPGDVATGKGNMEADGDLGLFDEMAASYTGDGPAPAPSGHWIDGWA